MSVIIAKSPENSGWKENRPTKKGNEDRKQEASKEIRYANFKKYAKKIPLVKTGENAIFLGVSGESGKKKVFLFSFEGREEKTAYLLNTDKDGVKFEIPRDCRCLGYFVGGLKVLDEGGVQASIEGEHIYVYESKGDIFIRIGMSEKRKRRMGGK